MDKKRAIVLTLSLVTSVWATGCDPDLTIAGICPTPTELSQSVTQVTSFDGLDMLLVVDNSKSMAEEQQIFATSIYKLINTLTDNPDPTWQLPDVDNVRIGVVSSDMGLQYGIGGAELSNPPLCTSDGDDGRFQSAPESVILSAGEIPCALDPEDPTGESSQCPQASHTDPEYVTIDTVSIRLRTSSAASMRIFA